MNIISRGVVEWSVVGPGVGTVSFSHRHTPNGPRSKGGEEEVESESLHIALYVAPPSSSRGLLGSSLSSSQSGNWHVYSKRKERRNVHCEQDGQTDGHGVHSERERDTGMSAERTGLWTACSWGLACLLGAPIHDIVSAPSQR